MSSDKSNLGHSFWLISHEIFMIQTFPLNYVYFSLCVFDVSNFKLKYKFLNELLISEFYIIIM